MSKLNLKESLETFGVIAIIASLLFLSYQIRQERLIARSELASETFSLMSSINQMSNDPEFSDTYAKMLQNPEELTEAEMLQVNSLLYSVKLLMLRECYLTEREVFVECDNAIRDLIDRYFGNKYAQTWWIYSEKALSILMPDWVDEEIAKKDSASDINRLNEIRGAL